MPSNRTICLTSFIKIGQLVHKLKWKDTHIKKDNMDIFRAYSYPSPLLGKKVERNGNINNEALWRPKICEVWLYSSDLPIQNRVWKQYESVCDIRLLLQCKCDLHSSGMLCSTDWWLVMDVSAFWDNQSVPSSRVKQPKTNYQSMTHNCHKRKYLF